MTDCKCYTELISALCDGELSDAEETELRAHMSGCDECRALFEAMTALGSALDFEDTDDESFEPLPDGFTSGVMRRVAYDKNRRRGMFYLRVSSIAAIAVLTFLTAVRGGILDFAGRSGSSNSAPESESSYRDEAPPRPQDLDTVRPPAAVPEAAPEAPSGSVGAGAAGDRGESESAQRPQATSAPDADAEFGTLDDAGYNDEVNQRIYPAERKRLLKLYEINLRDSER